MRTVFIDSIVTNFSLIFFFRDLKEGKVDLLDEVNYHSEGFVKFVVTFFILF